MKRNVLLCLVAGLLSLPVSGAVVHRYSFDINSNDLVGSADGTLVNGANISNGQLELTGGGSASGPYVSLDPNNPGTGIFINQYTTGLSLELWAAQPEQTYTLAAAIGGTWPDSGVGKDYVAIATSRGDGVSRGIIVNSLVPNVRGTERYIDSPELNDEIEHLYTLVIDDPYSDGSGTISYYIDGKLQGTVDLDGVLIANLSVDKAYLGKSVWDADDTMDISINEFRIYDGPLLQTQVVFNNQMGPYRIIDTVTETMTPADGATNIFPVSTLSWTVNPFITVDHYEVFLSNDPNIVDPNIALGTGDYTSALAASPSEESLNVSLDSSMDYFWRVDTIESGSMDRILGPMYAFTTAIPGPAFDSLVAPEDLEVLPGETVNFTVECQSASSAVTILWYKIGMPDVEITEADPDITIITNTAASGVTFTTTSTLTIENADGDDEGLYYATAVDSSGGPNFSDAAALYVQEGLIHRWSFNDTDSNHLAIVTDSVGGAHGILNNPAGWAVYANDPVYPGGKQLNFSQNTSNSNNPQVTYVDLPNGIISSIGPKATFMGWYTRYGNRPEERLFDFGESEGGENVSDSGNTTSNIYLNVQSGGYIDFNYRLKGDRRRLRTARPSEGVPCFVAVTWNEDTGDVFMYYNGVEVARDTLHMKLRDLDDFNNWFGRSQFGADDGFQGHMTEIRIFDEALSQAWIATHFNSGPDVVPENVCVNPPIGDIAPVGNLDCRVNFLDLAQLASDWLACGLLVCDE